MAGIAENDVITLSQAVELFPESGEAGGKRKRRLVGAETLRKAAEAGELPARKIGNAWFTTRKAVAEWVEGRK